MNTQQKQDTRGFILIDKPPGISSFDVIRRLRRITGIKRIGHTGTLDPFATGLLICALGTNTRLCKYIEAEDKSYTATLLLGQQTDTGDTEGKVVAQNDNIPGELPEHELIHEVLSLTELPLPLYSAIKIKGKPAYEYMRKGIPITLDKRATKIISFEILSYEPPYLQYSCRVSKGTYIRSLGEHIATYLGTVGHSVQLRRTSIGQVYLEQAISLDDLTESNFRSHFIPDNVLFQQHEGFTPNEDMLASLKNGLAVSHSGEDNSAIFLYNTDGKIVGVANRIDGMLLPALNL